MSARRLILATCVAVAVIAPGMATARGGGPAVQSLVVGRSGPLGGPATVTAQAIKLKAGRRPCAVAAGTPLAALDALRRSGGPAFALRDFGSCSRRARDAASLFVTQIGPDANGGHDGWVYKIDGRLGTTGAANTTGPFGDGARLRPGQRVLWFYCVMSSAGACQPTLELSLASAHAAPGGTIAVGVVADDDHGVRQPAAGATVTLAGASATTDGQGAATLTAPAAPGGYRVTATAPGIVQSFPQELTVP